MCGGKPTCHFNVGLCTFYSHYAIYDTMHPIHNAAHCTQWTFLCVWEEYVSVSSPSWGDSTSFLICSLSFSSGVPSSYGFTTLITCHDSALSSEGQWKRVEGREGKHVAVKYTPGENRDRMWCGHVQHGVEVLREIETEVGWIRVGRKWGKGGAGEITGKME